MNAIIHLDAGHGTRQYTQGKRSPDGRLFEGEYCRLLVRRLIVSLAELGYDCREVVPEPHDVPLSERCSRVNRAIRQERQKRHLFLSLHLNAAPPEACNREGWSVASGWTVYTARKCSVASESLARSLYGVAREFGLGGNRCVPQEGFWRADYRVLTATNCPAVLTESLFMTNREEVDWLLSERGMDTLVNLHLLGILSHLGYPASFIVG